MALSLPWIHCRHRASFEYKYYKYVWEYLQYFVKHCFPIVSGMDRIKRFEWLPKTLSWHCAELLHYWCGLYMLTSNFLNYFIKLFVDYIPRYVFVLHYYLPCIIEVSCNELWECFRVKVVIPFSLISFKTVPWLTILKILNPVFSLFTLLSISFFTVLQSHVPIWSYPFL